MQRQRYQAILKVDTTPDSSRPGRMRSGFLEEAEFVYAEIQYLAPDQDEAEYIAREYARHFDGASVDSVTEMS